MPKHQNRTPRHCQVLVWAEQNQVTLIAKALLSTKDVDRVLNEPRPAGSGMVDQVPKVRWDSKEVNANDQVRDPSDKQLVKGTWIRIQIPVHFIEVERGSRRSQWLQRFVAEKGR
jgi:hypothetical protein